MTSPSDAISLAHWRRSVAELYADVRRQARTAPAAAWRTFRNRRDLLFATHPQTPLSPDQLAHFQALAYFPYDPDWHLLAHVNQDIEPVSYTIELVTDGLLRFTTVARLEFMVGQQEASLELYWVEGYGGGLFLPFRDISNGTTTYGGGRYLLDTIKGADLGMAGDKMILDFNFAYNPSCAYNSRWVCPLPPSHNHLPFSVLAGEKNFSLASSFP